jgi:hypothetical protein
MGLALGAIMQVPLGWKMVEPRAAVPVSNARAQASRKNGAESRGLKTLEDKARSAQDALKHGLRAQKCLVLPEENADEFAGLEAALIEELAPVGALQTVLGAVAAWRLARADCLAAGTGLGPVPPTRRPRDRAVRGASCREQGVMQQHQPVVAEIDLVAEHEAGHAEDASREGLLDRRRELRRGLRLLEGYAEFGLVEPDPLDERGAEVIVQRRGAVDEQRPGREIG